MATKKKHIQVTEPQEQSPLQHYVNIILCRHLFTELKRSPRTMPQFEKLVPATRGTL